MSGIVGMWNPEGQPVTHAQLANLSAILAHRGPDGEGFWVQGPVGFACRLNRITPEASGETQPLVHPSGSVLVFDGRLDNREELLARLKPFLEVSSHSPNLLLVLAAYAEFGDRFPELLLGDFALGLFDASQQRLVLARDALGIRPLYYTRTRNTFLFASEIKALLAHPEVSVRPNDDHLANVLLGGMQDNEGITCFEGVFSVPPAHAAILTTQGFVIRRYWDFDVTKRTRLGSFPEYAEAFRFHFEQAIRRRLRSAHPVAVSVSGGLDSSSIFCQAETLRRRSPGHCPLLLGLSYTSQNGSPSDESVFLLDIEREYGVTIERVKGHSGLMNGAREEIWHVEAPLLDSQWNTTHQFMQAARDRGARTLVTGHWGDQILFPPAYLIDLFYGLEWNQIRRHLSEYSRWLTDLDPRAIRRQFILGLVKHHAPDILVRLWRKVRAKRRYPWYSATLLSRGCRQASNGSGRRTGVASAHAQSLYTEARSAHHVQCMEWNNKVAAKYGLEVAFPFLDRDLISFLMSIPGAMQTHKGIPKALLREGMREVLPDAIVRRTWKADFTHLVNEGMTKDFSRLVHCLQSDAVAIKMGYVKGDVIQAELPSWQGRIRGSDCQATWHLSNVLGLELWLRTFFGGKEEEKKAFSLDESDENGILSQHDNVGGSQQRVRDCSRSVHEKCGLRGVG